MMHVIAVGCAMSTGVLPAVTHADGTGRLQTVTPDQNPRYHALIRAFARRTGVPMVLNTSFSGGRSTAELWKFLNRHEFVVRWGDQIADKCRFTSWRGPFEVHAVRPVRNCVR